MDTDDDVLRMALHLCGAAHLCRCSGSSETICASSIKRAIEAMRLGAKLPDLRMERGGVAYGAFFSSLRLCHNDFDKVDRVTKEAWAAAAEAARAAS
ncbi:hypothetical protein [Acidiphilium angustum]|uniref:hypothetical protein n=1 Tax=Acidiphilium angustum TaxID=523 RepID=UPI00054DE11B|nr:hypothetical protein [Acidiphilium angustum]